MSESLADISRFTFEDHPASESLEPILVKLINGGFNDPMWRTQMRDLLERCSPGPFDVSSGDPRFDSEPIVVVTNQDREVLAKCGPVRDARSCFDAILFAATANALRKLLERSCTDCSGKVDHLSAVTLPDEMTEKQLCDSCFKKAIGPS